MRKSGYIRFFSKYQRHHEIFLALKQKIFWRFILIFARPIILVGVGATCPIISKFKGMPAQSWFIKFVPVCPPNIEIFYLPARGMPLNIFKIRGMPPMTISWICLWGSTKVAVKNGLRSSLTTGAGEILTIYENFNKVFWKIKIQSTSNFSIETNTMLNKSTQIWAKI